MVAGLFARLTCNGFQIPMSEGQRLEVALRQHSGSSLMDIPGHQEENSQELRAGKDASSGGINCVIE